MLNNPGAGAVYLFCFARSALLSTVEGNGVDGQSPLFLLPCLDVVAVVSFVSPEECRRYSAEERMHDLAWVGPRACRHEEVIEEVMGHSPVLPAGLGTIFDSPKSLEDRLRRHHDSIGRFLNLFTEKDEWSVKGLLNRTKAEEEYFNKILSTQTELLSLSQGTRYLQEQLIRAGAANALNRSLGEVTQRLADDLGRTSADWCVRKVLSREVVGGSREMILNWAFLVPRNAVTDFRTRIDRANSECVAEGLFLELSGPWPPYSFCPSLE